MSLHDVLLAKAFGGGGGSGAPSDWNANEGEAGYIKNRTHWTNERTLVYPLENTTRYYPFTLGDHYVVVWDGVEYVCEAKWSFSLDDGDGAHYLGNPKNVSGFDRGSDNGLPFTIVRAYTGDIFAEGDDISNHSVEIYHLNVNKIPTEYLPAGAHSVRYTDTVICEDVTVTTTDLMGTGMPIGVVPSITSNPIKAGSLYDIIWNGTKYTCYPFDMASDTEVNLAIGNRGMQFSDGMDTGEPCLFSFTQGMFGCFAKEFTTATVTIVEHTPCYQKLGDEYYDKGGSFYVKMSWDMSSLDSAIIYTTPDEIDVAFSSGGVPILQWLWSDTAQMYIQFAAREILSSGRRKYAFVGFCALVFSFYYIVFIETEVGSNVLELTKADSFALTETT